MKTMFVELTFEEVNALEALELLRSYDKHACRVNENYIAANVTENYIAANVTENN